MQNHVADGIYGHRHNWFHELPSHIKIASVFSFVLVVVLTPGHFFQAHLSYALIVIGLLIWNRIPIALIRKRLIIEIPFVLFAFFLPIFGTEPRIEFLLLVQIMSFMIRYTVVVTEELKRMAIARESRCFEAKGPKQWGVLARSGGALFIRSYERGERVHMAMLSRGYTGQLPLTTRQIPSRQDFINGTLLPLAAIAVILTWSVFLK